MTKAYTFIDIFNSTFKSEDGEDIKLEKITIPMIQRDYAQGRNEPSINRVRKRFLEALYDAISNNPITLDFVYGNIEDNGELIPLDGQQRLTTLFLFHWYIAKKEMIPKEEYQFLTKFSYKTRYSARDFCEKLIKFEPLFNKKTLSEEIINQCWFPWNWQKDPTISAMLVMLDDMVSMFSKTTNVWEKLKNGAITFYFLPIKDMGLTDELYIKMNSRGKPLTAFENFKAELKHELDKIDKVTSERIIRKIDKNWTDMLWQYKDEYNTIDNAFLHYFRFICDVICYKNGDTPLGKNYDEIDLINEYFKDNIPDVKKNIEYLETYFDCWENISKKTGIANFFNKFVSEEYEVGKIKFKNINDLDLFKSCLESYGAFINNSNRRQFTLGQFILLYAFTNYCLLMNDILESDFRRRIRVINNLVNNSEDEMSNSETRQGGNRIPDILEQVDSILQKGEINQAVKKGFNLRQIEEETKKLEWTRENPEKMENLFRLEDHKLLFGKIAILGLEQEHLYESFEKLFRCDYELIDCALLTINNYAETDKERTQLGTKEESTWIKLFHPTNSTKNFENTRNTISELLTKNANPDEYFLKQLINEYLDKCEKEKLYDWKYYYLKYNEFRPNKFGQYIWPDIENKPYELKVMVTKKNVSENAYNPFLKAVDKHNALAKEYFGSRIINTNEYIEEDNNSYIIYDIKTGIEKKRITINQNEKGIDKENRIEKFLSLYS